MWHAADTFRNPRAPSGYFAFPFNFDSEIQPPYGKLKGPLDNILHPAKIYSNFPASKQKQNRLKDISF